MSFDLNPIDSVSIYLFKVKNWNIRTICEIFSELTTKTSEQRQWRRSGVFIVLYDQSLYIFSGGSIVNFEYLNTG